MDRACCLPVLAALDLARTLAFHGDRLGCAGQGRIDHAILRRDAKEMHVWLARDRIHPEHASCYTRACCV
jgi:hypothetical protein